jgi:putative ABC transport system permease protein
LFVTFTFLGLFIACLGLLGLASSVASQRTKEIGIRKVLGAQVWQVVLVFSRELTQWALVANVIAWPVAYYLMSRWLQGFAYRISIGIGPFLLSGAIALILALLTVGWQSVRVGLANPVDSLRYE